MKKFIAILCVLVLVMAMFAGCGAKTEEPAEEPVDPAVPNPLAEVSGEEMLAATGLALEAPADATDVKYFTIENGSDMKTAQILFTLNGQEYCYRAEATGELEAYDLSGLYYEWAETAETEVNGRAATLNLCDEAAAISWLDIVPGVMYSLSCVGATDQASLEKLANDIFVPVQGEAEGDVITPEETPDYTGTYYDGDPAEGCNSFLFTKTGDATYDIEIGIYRLTTFEMKGSIMDGAVEFIGDDPNGNEMTGIFYPAEDGTYACTFTGSTWELLEQGTVFSGFTKAE